MIIDGHRYSPVDAAGLEKVRALRSQRLQIVRERKTAEGKYQEYVREKKALCAEYGLNDTEFSRIGTGKHGKRPRPRCEADGKQS